MHLSRSWSLEGHSNMKVKVRFIVRTQRDGWRKKNCRNCFPIYCLVTTIFRSNPRIADDKHTVITNQFYTNWTNSKIWYLQTWVMRLENHTSNQRMTKCIMFKHTFHNMYDTRPPDVVLYLNLRLFYDWQWCSQNPSFQDMHSLFFLYYAS